MFYLFNTRYILTPVLSWQGLTGNRFILIAAGLVIAFQLLFTYAPIMQILFRTVPLPWETWPLIFAVAFTVFILVELEKHLILINRR